MIAQKHPDTPPIIGGVIIGSQLLASIQHTHPTMLNVKTYAIRGTITMNSTCCPLVSVEQTNSTHSGCALVQFPYYIC